MVKKLTLLFLGLLLFGTVTLLAWYRVDGIPIEETATFMAGEGFSVSEDQDGSLVFQPDEANGYGIVIMHGALILPQSYAKSAAFFAQRGFLVYLPNGPGRMSIAAVDKAAQRMQEFNTAGWFFIGHSMGGMANLDLITSHPVNAMGLALWATAMPRDFAWADIPVLFIWGDTDGLLPAERFKRAQQHLPADTRYITLHGANHKNFAMYSHQFFDSEPTIDWMDQIDFANQNTAQFFAELLAQNGPIATD